MCFLQTDLTTNCGDAGRGLGRFGLGWRELRILVENSSKSLSFEAFRAWDLPRLPPKILMALQESPERAFSSTGRVKRLSNSDRTLSFPCACRGKALFSACPALSRGACKRTPSHMMAFSSTGMGKRPSQADKLGSKTVFPVCLSRKRSFFVLSHVIVRGL